MRMAANTSPEPFSNLLLSLAEDVLTIGLAALAAFHPVVILGIVILFVVLLIWLAPKVIRAIRGMFSFRRPLTSGRSSVTRL
jgi:hypothetical protein